MPPSNVDQISDAFTGVIVPLGALAISLAFTVWLARIAQVAQAREQLRQRDQRFVDEFLRDIEGFDGYSFVQVPLTDSTRALRILNNGYRRLGAFASGSTRGELTDFLGRQYQHVQANATDSLARNYELQSFNAAEQAAYGERYGELQREYFRDASIALEKMRGAARDWPDLQRRRIWLRKLAAIHIAQWPEPPTDVDLALDRQMLVSLPSRSGVRRTWDRLDIARRRLVDDWRYGRLGFRLQETVSEVAISFAARKSVREQTRASRTQRREDRLLRQIYELSYRDHQHRGRDFPWRFPENPDVFDAIYLHVPGPEETF
jgi:hypothetical protein